MLHKWVISHRRLEKKNDSIVLGGTKVLDLYICIFLGPSFLDNQTWKFVLKVLHILHWVYIKEKGYRARELVLQAPRARVWIGTGIRFPVFPFQSSFCTILWSSSLTFTLWVFFLGVGGGFIWNGPADSEITISGRSPWILCPIMTGIKRFPWSAFYPILIRVSCIFFLLS